MSKEADHQTLPSTLPPTTDIETAPTFNPSSSKTRLVTIYSHPWTQIILISLICFCCPGMYNALSGLGGSGQVDPTVAANANVALLSATAGTALIVGGPVFNRTGPRLCFLLGGWTYALYSGSLLNFNRELLAFLCQDFVGGRVLMLN
jgi:hypothetical protein